MHIGNEAENAVGNVKTANIMIISLRLEIV